MQKLNSLALGYAGAAISALGMLVMGILGNAGMYRAAAEHMGEWHMLFSLSPLGIVGGMIEAAVWGFVGFWLFGVFYNAFAKE